jgi:hypothetical protein
VPEGFEGFRAVHARDQPLAGSTVAHVEEDAVFDCVPEKGDLDAVALAEREFEERCLPFMSRNTAALVARSS